MLSSLVRLINRATRPNESQPGSIRGDFSIDITHNVVHASDSPENAERELNILFDPSELVDYSRIDDAILYSPERVAHRTTSYVKRNEAARENRGSKQRHTF